MKKVIFLVTFIFASLISTAQLCPGGGTNFSNAVFFDLAWIWGCTTGTSCNGGTTFDNRAACEPTTAMDPCAPAPTCGNYADMGSDIWFKFYATDTVVNINVLQNVSFFTSVQAFSGGPGCGSLTEIGCIIAGGPSQGALLTLHGMTKGAIYYFRVFGTSVPVSQRTGVFCFCGSTGMANYFVLPLQILSLNAEALGSMVKLKWTTTDQVNSSRFDIERSTDGINFTVIGSNSAIPTGASLNNTYSFLDPSPAFNANFYRLKMANIDGSYAYSKVIKIDFANGPSIHIYPNIVREGLPITIKTSGITGKLDIRITTLNGQTEKRETSFGSNAVSIETEGLQAGIYIVSVISQANESHHVIIIQ